ncbi:MAG: hypothetical protein M1824_000730 [Vezdaea acicularis]|nr:MAG: hypothetical protein M1824_000730 [Vezdaea acicularis]
MPTPRPESIPKAPAGYAAPPVKNAAPQLKPVEPEVRYTVIARLPFPRGDFVDPPPVDWDAAKDQALWSKISWGSKNNDIDWQALADQFEVTLPFVLQQAAWLYERQMLQIRAQMRKVGNTGGPAAQSATGGYAMRRGNSGGGRVPSALSMRSRDSPVPPSVPTTPSAITAQPMSRQSSANKATQTPPLPVIPSSPRPTLAIPRRLSSTNTQKPPAQAPPSPKSPSDAPSSSSSSTSSSDTSPQLAKSQLFKRAPRFTARRTVAEAYPHPLGPAGPSTEADDDDEEDEDFLPFSNPQDPSATLRTLPSPNQRRAAQAAKQHPQTAHSSTSSASSNQPVVVPSTLKTEGAPKTQRPPPAGPLSPKRAAELRKSTEGRNRRADGSDGTPSMGSSFSDLDDASVTQSALEEALASNMRAGSVASRVSTISQAIKSRYLQ